MDIEDNRPLSEYAGFVAHTPDRPTWQCRSCGAEWPCEPARDRMLAEARQDGSPTALAMLMWGYLEDYSLDVGAGPLAGAFERFIGWTRSRAADR